MRQSASSVNNKKQPRDIPSAAFWRFYAPNIFIIPHFYAKVVVEIFSIFLVVLRIDSGALFGYTKGAERQKKHNTMK